MSESVEQIEAKLCAYIEGDLNDDERAQIEAHLAANPSHEQMIRHLIRQKQAILRLPRERAPADLMDEFQSQIEREVLLKIEPRPQDAPSQMGWARILSAAAIFVLASGLGIVVYSVLPKGQPTLITMDDAAERQRPALAIRPEAQGLRGGAVADAPRPEVALMPLAQKGMPAISETEQLAKSAAAGGAADAANAPVAAQTPLANAAPMAVQDADTSQTLVITVTAGDLQQANEDVLAYLTSNNLDYVLADGQTRADVMARRSGTFYEPTVGRAKQEWVVAEQRQQIGKAGESTDSARPMRQAITAGAMTMRGARQEEAGHAVEEQVQAPAAFAPGVVSNAKLSSVVPPAASVPNVPSVPATAVVPATQPVERSLEAGRMAFGGGGGAGGGIGGDVVRSRGVSHAFGLASQQEQAKVDRMALADDTPAGNHQALDGGRVIIVRNMNGQQVSGLKEVLFQPNRDKVAASGRFLRVLAPAEREADGAPTTRITGVADLLIHPSKAIDALEGVLSQWSVPATQPAEGQAHLGAAADGLGVQRFYRCVIVLQNPVATISTAPATRPAAEPESQNADPTIGK